MSVEHQPDNHTHSKHSEHQHSAALPTAVLAVMFIGLIFFAQKLFDLDGIDFPMLLVGAALFLLLWRLLDAHLFAPYLHLLEIRESATVGAEQAAKKIFESAENVQKEYDSKLLEARVQAMKNKLDKILSAKKEAAKIIEKAEGEGQEYIRSVRWDMTQRSDQLRKETMAKSEEMARLVVARILSEQNQAVAH